MIGTVQEEDCDGLCWQYIVEKSGIQPVFVVSTEPTSCRIYRGQRGRMEIRVQVKGVSAHGSAPERGDNAILKMAPILNELQELHVRLKDDAFLGKGSLTVSEIFFTSPSRCAVADSCAISVDRRLTWGETWESALDEIRALPSVKRAGAKVCMYNSGLAISLFRDHSTRTRFSFASAANLFGLTLQDLDEGKSQIAHGETVRETATMVAFMADVIGIRDDMYIAKGNAYMREVAAAVQQGKKRASWNSVPRL